MTQRSREESSTFKRLNREDLELICFEYVTG